MKKSVKICRIFNISLAIFYIPFSLFCWLMQMINEITIDMEPSLYTKLINISSTTFAIIPFLCLVSIILSIKYRKKENIKLSFIFQFLPVAVFIANMVLTLIVDYLI